MFLILDNFCRGNFELWPPRALGPGLPGLCPGFSKTQGKESQWSKCRGVLIIRTLYPPTSLKSVAIFVPFESLRGNEQLFWISNMQPVFKNTNFSKERIVNRSKKKELMGIFANFCVLQLEFHDDKPSKVLFISSHRIQRNRHGYRYGTAYELTSDSSWKLWFFQIWNRLIGSKSSDFRTQTQVCTFDAMRRGRASWSGAERKRTNQGRAKFKAKEARKPSQ